MGKRKRGSSGLSGVILVDKPYGWTSHDVVAKMRGITQESRIGHAGTLDPMATGLLVVLIGPATRLSDMLTSQFKTYRATVCFGKTTDTDDALGSGVSSFPVESSVFNEDFAKRELELLLGEHAQIPPRYSAIKTDGQTAYSRARSGEEFQPESRDISIDAVAFIGVDAQAQTWTFDVTVSKGTYIRSIARDLGEKLGCGAHLSGLVRLSSGHFNLDDAVTMERLSHLKHSAEVTRYFLNPAELLEYPKIYSTDRHTVTGRPLSVSSDTPSSHGEVVVMSLDHRMLALYKLEDNRYIPSKVFPGGICGPRHVDCVASIGVFDGVHLGHRQLLGQVVAEAEVRGVESCAITFDRLPEEVIEHQDHPGQLMGLARRIELIHGCGIDHVVIVPFTQDVMNLEPQAFVDTILLPRVKPNAVVVGEGFRFGAHAQGDTQMLATLLAPVGCEVVVNELVAYETEPVSSSRIRMLLSEGNVVEVNKLLGSAYQITGEVYRGRGDGRRLGFPTANIAVDDVDILVSDGVYAGYASWGDVDDKPAAIFIGRSSLDPTVRTLEVHLIDADQTLDLYGRPLSVEFHTRIRGVARFDSIDSLREAIESDILTIKSVL